MEKQQGYADKWYTAMERPLQSGSWLLDRQGNLVGLLGQARHESDRLEPYLLGRGQGRYRSYRSPYAMMRQVRRAGRCQLRLPRRHAGLRGGRDGKMLGICRPVTTRTSAI